jgi:hypothetical protein
MQSASILQPSLHRLDPERLDSGADFARESRSVAPPTLLLYSQSNHDYEGGRDPVLDSGIPTAIENAECLPGSWRIYFSLLLVHVELYP